ncbi:hypothetical protein ANABIO32_16650 [Rossellomorea marisflavi]|nr:hypothetical protein ANABIO32_16650 [Rossellomorea marisflavi]
MVRPRRHEEALRPPRGKQPTAAKRHGPFQLPSPSKKEREEQIHTNQEFHTPITRTECLAAEGADFCGKGGAGRPRRHEEAQRPPRGKQPTAAKRHAPLQPQALFQKERGRNGYFPIKNPYMLITRTECLAAEGADS